jgi:hypothetical protein
MHDISISIILVVFAFVLAVLAAWSPAPPEPRGYRLLAAAFACYMASLICGNWHW